MKCDVRQRQPRDRRRPRARVREADRPARHPVHAAPGARTTSSPRSAFVAGTTTGRASVDGPRAPDRPHARASASTSRPGASEARRHRPVAGRQGGDGDRVVRSATCSMVPSTSPLTPPILRIAQPDDGRPCQTKGERRQRAPSTSRRPGSTMTTPAATPIQRAPIRCEAPVGSTP